MPKKSFTKKDPQKKLFSQKKTIFQLKLPEYVPISFSNKQ